MVQLPLRLLALCPQTGRWLETGVEVPEHVFERIQRLESWVFCPACAELHRWTRDTAVLEGQLPGKRQGTTNGPL
jgi:hypothetical protein